jgi:hypothetical protein
LIGPVPNITSSNGQYLYSSTSTVTFNYEDVNQDQTGIWSIPIYGLIPPGAYIVSISTPVDISADPSTTSVVSLFIRNTSSSTNTTTNPLTTAGATLTLSPTANVWASLSDKDTVIELTIRINSSSRATFTADQMTIVYRY